MAGQPRVLITGVSSGVGRGLVEHYLSQGWTVYGLSRREPVDLIESSTTFFHRCADLSRHEWIGPSVSALLTEVSHLDLAILNAGILGAFGDMPEISLTEMREVMDINLWSNKVLIDILLAEYEVDQLVTISSGASVNGNRGWAGYAISKAALNMMTKLYAVENPGTHFCALAPGLVDSEIQERIFAFPEDDRFPSIQYLKRMRYTADMPTHLQAGKILADAIQRIPTLFGSGSYADVRQSPLADILGIRV